ncbi:hypothetical protein FACS189460_1360 [Deltaproteobacteria bacterium]|nr:hypothetical protein FACS189460_1360 [Deltaproteobacteria bacterium]
MSTSEERQLANPGPLGLMALTALFFLLAAAEILHDQHGRKFPPC